MRLYIKHLHKINLAKKTQPSKKRPAYSSRDNVETNFPEVATPAVFMSVFPIRSCHRATPKIKPGTGSFDGFHWAHLMHFAISCVSSIRIEGAYYICE